MVGAVDILSGYRQLSGYGNALADSLIYAAQNPQIERSAEQVSEVTENELVEAADELSLQQGQGVLEGYMSLQPDTLIDDPAGILLAGQDLATTGGDSPIAAAGQLSTGFLTETNRAYRQASSLLYGDTQERALTDVSV